MSQAYFDLADANDPYTLPNCEVFYADDLVDDDGDTLPAGWYWWACFPGCLPDGDANGPFDMEADALADAQDLV